MLNPKIVIFMGTYNGQHYLVEQLDSICSQSYKNWELWVSDDGSDDNTYQILKDYQNRLGSDVLFIQTGPRKGFAANFLSLVCNENARATYYAYSDQDDIWERDKLKQAVDYLARISEKKPALYCARTKLIDSKGTIIGISPYFKKTPGFLNALVQNIGGGNTMVFNNKALNLLREAGENFNIVAHDWWTYIIVAGAGGVVFYDPQPTMFYRQHGNNLIGSNLGWYSRFRRISMLLNGRFKKWNDINFQALYSARHLLTEENRLALMKIMDARNSKFFSRLVKMRKVGVHRQTILGNIGLIAAIFLKKI